MDNHVYCLCSSNLVCILQVHQAHSTFVLHTVCISSNSHILCICIPILISFFVQVVNLVQVEQTGVHHIQQKCSSLVLPSHSMLFLFSLNSMEPHIQLVEHPNSWLDQLNQRLSCLGEGSKLIETFSHRQTL